MADDLTDEQVKAYRLADNKTAEEALWDKKVLSDELMFLSFEMSDFGLDFNAIFTPKPEAGYKQTKNLNNFFRSPFEFGSN